MKLKINKACDIRSISVLPPRRTGGSAGVGASGSSAAAAAAAVAVGSQQQPRSQPLSQQSFSQGAGGSVGGSSLLHSQSQLSQASFDENLLGLHLASPARDQRFGLHDDSSKKMPISSASCVREESQLQLAKTSSNTVHRWNPSLPDSRFQVPTEDVERKFQHLASSVHKMGMVLDLVQNDAMQLNRAMKEASLDYGSIQQKIIVLDNSLQKILKEQDDLKVLVESSTKSVADQLSVLNSHSNKLDEISSTLSVWPKQIETDIRQLQSDIFRIFTKEMEGIVRAIRSLNSRPAAIQMPTDQGGTSNGRPLTNQIPVVNERPQVNQTQVASWVSQTPVETVVNQTPVASLVNQTPVKNGRHLVGQTPAANGKPLTSQASVENGRSLMTQVPAANGQPLMSQESVANARSLMSQVPAANGQPLMSQASVANGRSLMSQVRTANGQSLMSQMPAPYGRSMMNQKPAANGRPQANRIPVASGRPHTNKTPVLEVHPAPLACPTKAADPKLKVEAGKVKVLPQKLTGSRTRVTPKQEEVPLNTKATRTAAAAKKAPPVMIIIDSDDDSEGRASCMILKPSESAGDKECHLMKEAADESLQILRRARKRRRREMQAIVPAA